MKKLVMIFSCLLLMTGCSVKEYKTEINVLNWSSYIPNSVIRDFEKKYDIKVNYGTYSSNEELLAKVSSVKEGTYDLVFPSDYMISIMKYKDLVQKVDKSKLTNYGKIDNKYLGLDYDPDNEYSIPFLAATVVIAVNRDLVKEDISGYQDLVNERYRNSIVLIDDTRIIIGSALMALGYDMNSVDKRELEEAKDWLLEMKANIKAMDSDSPKSFLISKEASIGVMWSAEAILAKEVNSNIEIIVPSEGYAVSIDNFVIMKGCKNLEAVYLFIDYILDSEVMEKIVMDYPYSSVNVDTNERIANNKLFGSDYLMIQGLVENGKMVENIGEYVSLYDRVWASIK